MKNTNVNRYGCGTPSQNEEVKQKMKNTNIDRYGFDNPMKNEEVNQKMKNTNVDRYGFESPFQNKEIKQKIKDTNMDRYGCENPMQNAEVAEKASKNAYKVKDYVYPSGRVDKIQGYEHYALDELLMETHEDDIITKRTEVPVVWYDMDNKPHRYYVDIFIPKQNKCIEVKSTWTYEKKKDLVLLKQKAVIEAGYECEIWVYNGKGMKLNI